MYRLEQSVIDYRGLKQVVLDPNFAHCFHYGITRQKQLQPARRTNESIRTNNTKHAQHLFYQFSFFSITKHYRKKKRQL